MKKHRKILILILILFSLFFVAILIYLRYLAQTPNIVLIGYSVSSTERKLSEFKDRYLYSQSPKFEVYGYDFINNTSKILVYIVEEKRVVEIAGEFEIPKPKLPSAMYYTSDGKYLAMPYGDVLKKNVLIFNLVEKKLVGEPICIGELASGNNASIVNFWNSYVLYNSCEESKYIIYPTANKRNIPSIIALNLETEEIKVLFQSDNKSYYIIDTVLNNILSYTKNSVEKEADWYNRSSFKMLQTIKNEKLKVKLEDIL